MAIDIISIASLVVSTTTALGGFLGILHLKKSKCLGSECICETEDKKIERVKSIIDKEYNNIITKEPLKNHLDLNQSNV